MRFITGYLFALLLVPFSVLSQNNIKSMMCEGPLPNDLKQTITDIVLNNKNNKYKKNSLLGVYDIFSSGNVVYGNQSWALINTLGKRIIQRNNLDSNVRFYILRSQFFNAFATSEGYIFATTALLANIKTEDELAFILCHELSHYILKHNLKQQEHSKEKLSELRKNKKASRSSVDARIKTFDDFLKEYYSFSRSHELEADSLGLILYLKSGFHHSSPVTSLSNLEHQYPLFFEEKFYPGIFEKGCTVVKDFEHIRSCSNGITKFKFAGNTDSLVFKTDVSEAKNESEYLTHPDWSIRVDRIKNFLKQHKPENMEPVIIDLSIQQECLSEMILTEYRIGNYFQALTYLHILEKRFPQNTDINRMKGACLSSIYLLFHGNKFISLPRDFLDERSCFTDLFYHVCAFQYPKLRYLSLYYNNVGKGSDGFNRMCGHYSLKIYNLREKISNYNTIDTVLLSQCDVDKKIVIHRRVMDSIKLFVGDINRDSLEKFYRIYEMSISSGKLYNTSNEFPVRVNKDHSDSIILLSPTFVVFQGRNTKKYNNPLLKHQNKEFIVSELVRYGRKNNINYQSVNFDEKSKLNTDLYNQYFLLLSMVNEYAYSDNNNNKCPASVLYSQEMMKKTGCRRVQIVQLSHKRPSNFRPLMVLMDVYTIPATFFTTLDVSGYFRSMYIHTNTITLVFNLETCSIEFITINESSIRPDRSGISVITQKVVSDTKEYIVR